MSYRDPMQEALRVLATRGTRYASPDSVAAEALRARHVPAPGPRLPHPLEHQAKTDLPVFCSLFTQSDGCLYLPEAYLPKSAPDLPAVDVSSEATLVASDGEEHDGSVDGGDAEPVSLRGDLE